MSKDSPVITNVELGIAKLNIVSHHGYLRCAKYVNPLVGQLSSPESEGAAITPASYNRNSLIILDPEAVEDKTEEDVYEDQMESELESSLENAIDLDIMNESDTTLSENSMGDDSDEANIISGNESDDKNERKNLEKGKLERMSGGEENQEVDNIEKGTEIYCHEADEDSHISQYENNEIEVNVTEAKIMSELEFFQTEGVAINEEVENFKCDISLPVDTEEETGISAETEKGYLTQNLCDVNIQDMKSDSQEKNISDTDIKEIESEKNLMVAQTEDRGVSFEEVIITEFDIFKSAGTLYLKYKK